MYVIWHDFQGMQRDMQLVSLQSQQGFQAFCHRPLQNRLAILRAEDKVVFERKNRASVACIPVLFHTQSIARCSMNNNYLTRKGQGEKAALLTQDAQSSAS